MVARTDTASDSVVVVPLLGDTLSQALSLVADHPKVPPPGLVAVTVPIVVKPVPGRSEP